MSNKIKCWVPVAWEDDTMDQFPPSALDVKPGDKRVEWYCLPGTPLLFHVIVDPTTPMNLTVYEATELARAEPLPDLTQKLSESLCGSVATAESFHHAARMAVFEWEKMRAPIPKP